MSNFDTTDNFIARWLEGKLSDTELEKFEKTEDYKAYQEIIIGVDKYEKAHFDLKKEFENQKEFNKTLLQSKSKVLKLRPWMYVAAASVVLLTVLCIKLVSTSEITISAPIAQKLTHTLPDQSIVTLNAESTISYDKKSFDSKRELTLKGHAFFKVKKGASFTVNTNNGAVKVLGTQFDVYNRNKKLEVKCYEGKVEVKNNEHSIILTQGKAVKTNTQNMFLPFSIISKKPEWTQGFSAFTDSPLNEIIDEIERQYAVEINAKSVNIKRTFTGFFTHKDLKSALKTCFQPLNIKYTFVNTTNIVLSE